MAIRHVHLEREELVRQGLDFADALHLLRSEGCPRFATLDRALAKAALWRDWCLALPNPPEAAW